MKKQSYISIQRREFATKHGKGTYNEAGVRNNERGYNEGGKWGQVTRHINDTHVVHHRSGRPLCHDCDPSKHNTGYYD